MMELKIMSLWKLTYRKMNNYNEENPLGEKTVTLEADGYSMDSILKILSEVHSDWKILSIEKKDDS